MDESEKRIAEYCRRIIESYALPAQQSRRILRRLLAILARETGPPK